MKELRTGMIVITIITTILWIGHLTTNHVSIITPIVGNFIQLFILLKILKNKKEIELKHTCKTCRFNEGIYCNVGSYYAEKGQDKVCFQGELWEKIKN